jgi:hypothetical protein
MRESRLPPRGIVDEHPASSSSIACMAGIGLILGACRIREPRRAEANGVPHTFVGMNIVFIELSEVTFRFDSPN